MLGAEEIHFLIVEVTLWQLRHLKSFPTAVSGGTVFVFHEQIETEQSNVV